jgi:hypothetical protein
MAMPKLANNVALVLGICAALLLPACHVNVKKNADESDKKVDIDTPLGGIHVSEDADVRNIGLPVYPGARPVVKVEEGEDKSANVNISTSFFGLKVAAKQFESDDPPEKVLAFYQGVLKKFGPVLSCRQSWHGDADVDIDMDNKHDRTSRALACKDESGGKATELKAGTRENQHLVQVEAQRSGSRFALAHVEVHGKEGTI